MNRFFGFINRVFGRRKAPRFDYIRESDLPADPTELIRAGIIREWRVSRATNEPWFVADAGAIEWFVDNVGAGR